VIATRAVGMSALALVLTAHAVQAQDKAQYRDFRLGSSLAAVSAQVNGSASDARMVHERPAVIQDLQWRTPYFAAGSNEPQRDPVQQILFSFYNDQLFRMAVDYDRQRTDGMTDADMIAALSQTYGVSARPLTAPASKGASQIAVASGTAVARWGDAGYSLVLFRSSIGTGFQLVVTSTRLDALARTADAQAVLMDEREAPLREIARQRKDAEDARVLQEKARLANKATFRP
jgi:hypothetical protein